MKKCVSSMFGIALIISSMLVLIIGVWSLTGLFVSSNDYDNFAKCLTEKGVTMYGADWCSHCQNQKKMFGSSWQYINYVECDPNGNNANPQLCTQKNIQAFPTWIIDGKLYTGEKTIQELSSLAGCPLS